MKACRSISVGQRWRNAATLGIITWAFIRNTVYIETIGFMAVLFEALLGIPQFLRNLRMRSTEGMSVKMVGAPARSASFRSQLTVVLGSPVGIGWYLQNRLLHSSQCSETILDLWNPSNQYRCCHSRSSPSLFKQTSISSTMKASWIVRSIECWNLLFSVLLIYIQQWIERICAALSFFSLLLLMMFNFQSSPLVSIFAKYQTFVFFFSLSASIHV